MSSEILKKFVGESVVDVLEDAVIVGCGTGSTVRYFLESLKSVDGIRCIPTSDSTKAILLELGKNVVEVDGVDHIDIAVDGADWVDLDSGVCIKGGGGAHFLEKRVAEMTDRFVVIVDSGKVVGNFDGKVVPLDVEVADKWDVMKLLGDLGYKISDRERLSDTGGALLDVVFDSDVADLNLEEFNDFLENIEGVRATGVFLDQMDECWVACSEEDLRVYEF